MLSGVSSPQFCRVIRFFGRRVLACCSFKLNFIIIRIVMFLQVEQPRVTGSTEVIKAKPPYHMYVSFCAGRDMAYTVSLLDSNEGYSTTRSRVNVISTVLNSMATWNGPLETYCYNIARFIINSYDQFYR